MTGYDFDKTIYDGNSFIDFYFFCLKRRIYLFFFFLIQVVLMVFSGSFTRKRSKRIFSLFLLLIPNVEKEMEKFWEKGINKIKGWYFDLQTEEDIVISASPDFFLKPICEKLNIKHLIATQMSAKSGKIYGKNIFGEEKVNLFVEKYNNRHLNAFYTDSESDFCMGKVAEKLYCVDKNDIKEVQYN